MMDEYISRKDTIAKIREEGIYGSGYSDSEREENVIDMIESVPAADVRPVVLCLHCKHWDTSWAPNCGKEYGHFCPMVGTVTRADWFCADGEKREES